MDSLTITSCAIVLQLIVFEDREEHAVFMYLQNLQLFHLGGQGLRQVASA